MPTEWSGPLFYICLGMILGALTLHLLSRLGNGVRSKHSAQAQVHPFDQLAQPIPLHPRPVPDKYYLWLNLTAREKEVAHLVAQDKTNGEIARELGISPSTIETHLKHIYRKLEINSRRQLTRVVAQLVEYGDDTA